MAPERKNARRTTPQDIDKGKKNANGNDIDALTNEISSLKKLIADKDYIIDDLVLERDQISDDEYAQRVKYETAQKQLADTTGKIRDLEHERASLKKEIQDLNDDVINSLVAERDEIGELRRKERKQLAEATGKIQDLEHERAYLKKENCDLRAKLMNEQENRSHSTATKIFGNENATPDTAHTDNESHLKICNSADSTDSGIGMQSLTQLIDDRIGIMIHAKLKDHDSKARDGPHENIISQTSKYALEQCTTNLDTDRKRNIIVHGLKEDGISDEHQIKEIFTSTTTQHAPMSICRLGPKKANKIRPIMLRMQSLSEKEEFMSKLWMLKNVRMKFKNLSITNDYTLDERKMIKECVAEANRRNTTGTKGYLWKVRGTPKEGLRIIKIASQE